MKNKFQAELSQALKEMNSFSKVYAFADKFQDIYRMSPNAYNNLLKNSITSEYKQGDENVKANINSELHLLACQLNSRAENLVNGEAKSVCHNKGPQAHNFQNNPSCLLIKPLKSELGKVSHRIVTKIKSCIRIKLSVNQWRNTQHR